MQNCCISIANALEIPQTYTQPSIYSLNYKFCDTKESLINASNTSRVTSILMKLHRYSKKIKLFFSYIDSLLQVCSISIANTLEYNRLFLIHQYILALQWRHNEHNGISNHPPHCCLFNRSFRCRWKKTSKLHVTGLCAGNSSVTGEFPTQRASNAENVSIWWCYHGIF